MRPRPPAWISITSRCSSRPRQAATSCGRTPTPGLDPDNENQRNFHDFLRRSNYKVVSKDIRKYGDGKVKANLDIELVVDMMKTARNLDIAIVVSGDGDFAPAIRAVQEQGVRVEVISFRGNTSSDLIEVADLFTDIVQLARVEKGSRSGRRVSDDGEDLSMTEVPTSRPKAPAPVAAVVAAVAADGPASPSPSPPRPARAPAADPDRRARRGRHGNGAGPVALPGERLARVGGLTEADLAAAEVFTLDDLEDAGGEVIGQTDADRPAVTATSRARTASAAVAAAVAVVEVADAAGRRGRGRVVRRRPAGGSPSRPGRSPRSMPSTWTMPTSKRTRST